MRSSYLSPNYSKAVIESSSVGYLSLVLGSIDEGGLLSKVELGFFLRLDSINPQKSCVFVLVSESPLEANEGRSNIESTRFRFPCHSSDLACLGSRSFRSLGSILLGSFGWSSSRSLSTLGCLDWFSDFHLFGSFGLGSCGLCLLRHGGELVGTNGKPRKTK